MGRKTSRLNGLENGPRLNGPPVWLDRCNPKSSGVPDDCLYLRGGIPRAPLQDRKSEGNNENDRGSDNEHVSETSFAHENVDEFQNVEGKKVVRRNIPGNASQPKPNPTTSGNKEKASSVNDKFQASGSILEVMDELIKVGQTMGYNMDGCLGNKAKKGWIQELNTKHRVNFVALQETKMEKMDLFSIKALWGNLSFDYAFSPSIGYSGGILCVWDPRLFVKDNSTVSDSFLAISGDFIHHLIALGNGRMCPLRKGFDKMVEDSWKNFVCMESNSIIKLKKKLQSLKSSIKHWLAEDNQKSNEHKRNIQNRLIILDKIFDQGSISCMILIHERSNLLKELQDFNKSSSLDMAQKAKIRWAIEGDENSKFFHGIINKKRS
ncbi:RNA-directed DNA polymerase, eukaryota [Tanacetum coccineum]